MVVIAHRGVNERNIMNCASIGCKQSIPAGSLQLYCDRCMEEILACKLRENWQCRRGLLIIGHARHGKDTLAEIWDEVYGLRHQNSSMMCARIFIYDALKDKYGYNSVEECFEDRVNHRQEWFEMISKYNSPDKSSIGTAIMSRVDCYTGMRCKQEIEACKAKGLFKLIIWVDASDRHGPEDPSSFDITEDDADIIIQNNGTLEEFREKAIRLGRFVFSPLRKRA